VYQLGVNAPRLNNVVLASPYKSRIVVAQSIGRGLRLAEGKTICDVYDVADDISHGRWRNHTLRHSYERVKLYASEGMDYEVYMVDLPEGSSLNKLTGEEEAPCQR
jgi:superfamily II DNA or RNA helicase